MININKIELTEKEKNILLVLNAILSKGETSSNHIAKDTNLSLSTISRVLGTLRKKKVIVNRGKEVTGLGRRPELISFNKHYGHMIHFNIKAGSIAGYLLDLESNIISEHKKEFSQQATLAELVDIIKGVYDHLEESSIYGREKRKILAAGFSVPGLIDEKVRLVKRIPDLHPFNDLKAFDYLEQVLEVPVIINNMARLSAIGERNENYPYCENLVLFDVTNYLSIGSGIIINGKPFKGSNNAAGEIGDMFFERANFSNGYSKNTAGCLETYSSITVLYSKIYKALRDGKAPILKEIMDQKGTEKVTLNLVEQAIERQDFDVCEIYDDILKIWAIAIINIFSLIDPDILVLGGIIDETNTTTLNRLKYFVRKGLHYEPDIRLTTLGDRAQTIGGAYLLKQYVYNKIILNQVLE